MELPAPRRDRSPGSLYPPRARLIAQRGSEYYLKTLVKKSASLGANCTIVCGVTIGQYSFVGAGAVVTKDIPDFALVVGNPAKRIGWMCMCGKRLNVSDLHCIQCEKCGRKYKLKKSILIVKSENEVVK